MKYCYAVLLKVAFPFTGYNNVEKIILSEHPVLYEGYKIRHHL